MTNGPIHFYGHLQHLYGRQEAMGVKTRAYRHLSAFCPQSTFGTQRFRVKDDKGRRKISSARDYALGYHLSEFQPRCLFGLFDPA